MLERRWRSSGCPWLTAVAMETLAESAFFPGIRIAAGIGPGGSASLSRLDTTSRLGMISYDVTAAEPLVVCYAMTQRQEDNNDIKLRLGRIELRGGVSNVWFL